MSTWLKKWCRYGDNSQCVQLVPSCRYYSVWSDASGSGATGNTAATANTRDMMLRKAYGSQLDLTGKSHSDD